MLNKIKKLVAVAALSGTVSANVHAATVTVQKGDTLWNLSRVHNTTVVNIEKLNHLSTDLIFPGEKLTILPEKHYTVKQGDTLWDIAESHHVSVHQIKEWNNLITDLIYPGSHLVIFDDIKPSNNIGKHKTIKPASPPLKAMSVPAASGQAPKPAPPAPTKSTTAAAPAAKKQITVKATAYTASCDGCSGITATGINIKANPNEKVIAVDPNVIPLGSKVYVQGVGYATAADTGGAIKGNRIDVFIPSEKDAMEFGVKELTVTIVN